jgi:hypothetical protein
MIRHGDLSIYNNNEILNIIWQVFANLANSAEAINSSKYFSLFRNISETAFIKCNELGLILDTDGPVQQNYPFRHILLKVFYSAINMGLIIPSTLDQGLDWSYNSGIFHFTNEGIKYFSNGFISIDDPGYLGIALRELQKRASSIDDGQIELLLEGQRCIKSGCYRAGMVVIGVANENLCLGLLDAILMGCSPPKKESPLNHHWNSLGNPSLSFTMRWKPGVKILEEMKNKLRPVGKGESWWQWWKMIPGSLYTLGEAVRIARNSAAHDSNRLFSKAEVALLLSAMPIQLEMIATITEFLKKVPSHLIPINI